MAQEKIAGTVKWWSDDKGYGFITPDTGSDDVFVHFSGIAGKGHRSLENGDRVVYDIERTPKGVQARNVERVSAAAG